MGTSAHPIARTEGGLTHHNTIVFGRPVITDVRLDSVHILRTHEVVRNWDKDWERKGSVEMPPLSTSTRSDPWTIGIGEKLRLRLELAVRSELAGPEDFMVEGTFMDVKFSQRVTLRGGINRPELESIEALPTWCTPMIGNLDLRIAPAANPALRFDPPDVKLNGAVTFERPQDGAPRDAGITWKRVVEATRQIRQHQGKDLHGIAQAMVAIVPAYTTAPLAHLRAVDHPRYHGPAGAWALLGHIPELGECQAIVRLALALMRQAGCAGDYARVNCWADKVGAGLTFHEADGEDGGLPEGTPTTFRFLAAHELVVGGKHIVMDAGVNRYEACLRVRHDGRTRYYGGGMPGSAFDSPRAVVEGAFWGLVEGVWATKERGSRAPFTVTRILHRWR